ncbi:hypothetical protein [Modestobacter sp. NPDC049651]|uniref:YveK family protein n=1 Tax=unclassified Modestobacter TaxID=2643866 RepID=UPI0033D72D1D
MGTSGTLPDEPAHPGHGHHHPAAPERGRGWRSLRAAGGALVVAGVLVGGAAALVVHPVYTTTAESFASLTRSSAGQSDPFGGSQFVLQRMQSYAQLATSRDVLGGVVTQMGLHETADELADAVSVTAPPDTVVLRIAVRDRDPERAASIADAVAARQAEVVEAMEAVGGPAGTAPVRITPVDQADVPDRVAAVPRVARFAVVGGVVGLVLAGCLALVRRSLRRG